MSNPIQEKRFLRKPISIVVSLAAIVFVIQFGNSLGDVPSLRLLEDIICRDNYARYPRGLMDEALCQTAVVQGELNTVATGLTIAGFIPGLLTALLYGSLADQWGRKPILGLCIAGMVLSSVWFILVTWTWEMGSIRLVWTSPVPLLIGGGNSVAESMVFTIVSDLSTETNRATHLQIIISAVLLAETVAPIAAQALMESGIWLPIFLSPAIATFGALFLIFIPETLHLRITKQAEGETTRFGVSGTTFVFKIRAIGSSMKATIGLFASRPIMLLTPSAALAIPIATTSLLLAQRSIPIRYDWTLGQTGILLGLRTGLSILVLLVFLPLLAYLFRRTDTRRQDLRMAQLSAAAVVLGFTIFAAAPVIAAAMAGLVVFTLGSGVPSLCRAVMSDIVPKEKVGRMFAALAMWEMVGYVAFALGLGACFQVGLSEDRESFRGLPFYAAASVSALTGLGLCFVRLPVELATDIQGSELGGRAGPRESGASFQSRTPSRGAALGSHPPVESAV